MSIRSAAEVSAAGLPVRRVVRRRFLGVFIRFGGDAIVGVKPGAQVDEPAPLGAKRKKTGEFRGTFRQSLQRSFALRTEEPMGRCGMIIACLILISHPCIPYMRGRTLAAAL